MYQKYRGGNKMYMDITAKGEDKLKIYKNII